MTTPAEDVRVAIRVAIQGERGSNSHMAAMQLVPGAAVVPCALSADVLAALLEGRADCALLPIENTLHGSVAEHYDLLLTNPLRIDAESLLPIRHHLIAAPGVKLAGIRTILSHPVALNQCRNFLASFTQARAVPFYDTAGSVKHVIAEGLRDTAGIAPELAAEEYGGEILRRDLQDHAQNLTRFHLLRRASDSQVQPERGGPADKMSVAFAVDHRPGTLVMALRALAATGVNLTRIESRPVPGQPWEYVFFAEFRYEGEAMADAAVAELSGAVRMIRELGRYRAAVSPSE